MNSKKIKAYIQLSRPVNVLITIVSIPVACWIADRTVHNVVSFILAAATGAMVTAGANALNDAFDIEIDRINRPDRPLPLGVLSRRNAQDLWFRVSLLAICINVFINVPALIIVLLAIILLYYYSARLKRTILAGNIVVGFLTGMAFIYGGAVVGHVERALIPALFAFLINVAREVVKDVEDIEGDRAGHAGTLPIEYGIKPALLVATGLILLLICVTIAVILYSVYQTAFTYIVIISDLLMSISVFMLWQKFSPVQMRRISNLLKISMVVGLAAIIAGSM
jgi:geranylgeranylglycerol-phosphate geranylgeranyltransferase